MDNDEVNIEKMAKCEALAKKRKMRKKEKLLKCYYKDQERFYSENP